MFSKTDVKTIGHSFAKAKRAKKKKLSLYLSLYIYEFKIISAEDGVRKRVLVGMWIDAAVIESNFP